MVNIHRRRVCPGEAARLVRTPWVEGVDQIAGRDPLVALLGAAQHVARVVVQHPVGDWALPLVDLHAHAHAVTVVEQGVEG
ncbi:hypothetical protein D3C78_995580 [compost metagenome]